MRISEAEEILHLKQNYEYSDVRKSYLKLSLKYHPDKNKNGSEHFKLINEAYHTINDIKFNKKTTNSMDCHDDITTMSYSELLKYYYNNICEKYNINKEHIFTLLSSLTNKTRTFTYELINNLDSDTSTEVLELLNKYQFLFGFDNEIFREIKDVLQRNNREKQVITLNPSLYDLFNNNIYILNINGTQNYVPLWHNEVEFNGTTVFIQPYLPNNMELSDNNKLHIHKHVSPIEMFSEKIEIELYPNKTISILCSELKCKKYQTFTLFGQGISYIDDSDIFNVKNKNDIVIHIYVK